MGVVDTRQKKGSLERLMHEYFKEAAPPLYEAAPTLFYAFESALVSTSTGIFIAMGRDFYTEPANHYLALVGLSGAGKGWLSRIFRNLAGSALEPLPFASGQAWLEALQEKVSVALAAGDIARTYTWIDEATLLLRNVGSYGGDVLDTLAKAYDSSHLTWRVRDRKKPSIEIPEKSYIHIVLMATTIQNWSVFESKFGDTNLYRRFWVLNVPNAAPYIHEEEPDEKAGEEVGELAYRIRNTLRAFRRHILTISYTNLAEAQANEKIKNLNLRELRKRAVAAYALRLTAARIVANAIEVPEAEEFRRDRDKAFSWIREQAFSNLENAGVEVKTISEYLALPGLDFEEFPRTYLLRAKVTHSSLPKSIQAARQEVQKKLDEVLAPNNFDLNVSLILASLADVVEASNEAYAHIIYDIKQLREAGTLMMTRRDFARRVLNKTHYREYKALIEALNEAGIIRLVSRYGHVPDLSVAEGRVYVILNPEAPICGNCRYFGNLHECKLFEGGAIVDIRKVRQRIPSPDAPACEKFELEGGD